MIEMFKIREIRDTCNTKGFRESAEIDIYSIEPR